MIVSILGVLQTAVLVLCALVLHEYAHVFAVNYLGGRVEKVGIFPLGFAARFRGLERLFAWERYVIYGAGSLANVLGAVWAFSVSRISYFGIPWLEDFAFYSIVLCVFNLIPILPLDGGRILHQFLSNRIGILRANRVMLKLGTVISILLIILGVVQVVLFNYNITLLCAGVYIKRQNKTMLPTLQMEFFRFLAAKKKPARARLMPVRTVKLSQNTTVKQALNYLTIDHFTEFECEFENKKECFLTEEALLESVLAVDSEVNLLPCNSL